MYHSVIIRVDGRFIDTWDDWHLIPSTRPVIAPAQERTNFVTVGGRDGVLDFSQTLAGRPVFDNRSGSIEFYVENDYWDWETAYTTICETLQGKRVKLALEDNPAHYYEGLLYVDKWTSDKGHSKISLKYNLHPTMQTLELDTLEFVETSLEMTRGMVTDLHLKISPADTFYRKAILTVYPAGIVRITDDSLVEAIKNGATEIRAACGPRTTVCKVTVKPGDYRNITLDVNGCAMTNHSNKIQNGKSYENTLTAPEGYALTRVTVANTAGGTEGTFQPDGSGKTARISLASVTKDICITAGIEPLTVYGIQWELDCVEALTPIKQARKGDTVTLKIQSVTKHYSLNNIQVKMGGVDVSDKVVCNDLRTAAITLQVSGNIVVTASAIAHFTLNDCSWEMIDRIARSGKAASYFNLGDTKEMRIPLYSSNKRVRNGYNLTAATIIGFNHNPSVEGASSIHFMLTRYVNPTFKQFYISKKATDNTYGVYQEWGFEVNLGKWIGDTLTDPGSSGGSSGGSGSDIITPSDTSNTSDAEGDTSTTAASDLYVDFSDTLLSNLPEELRQVIRKTPKTVYDTGTKAMKTEARYLWLLSPTEVFGETGSGSTQEAKTQKQYDYFKSDELYPAVRNFDTWLRSPNASDTKSFCRIKTYSEYGGNENGESVLQQKSKLDSGWATDTWDTVVGFSLGSDSSTESAAADETTQE